MINHILHLTVVFHCLHCIALTIGCYATATLCYLPYPEALYDPSGSVHPLVQLSKTLNNMCYLPYPEALYDPTGSVHPLVQPSKTLNNMCYLPYPEALYDPSGSVHLLVQLSEPLEENRV